MNFCYINDDAIEMWLFIFVTITNLIHVKTAKWLNWFRRCLYSDAATRPRNITLLTARFVRQTSGVRSREYLDAGHVIVVAEIHLPPRTDFRLRRHARQRVSVDGECGRLVGERRRLIGAVVERQVLWNCNGIEWESLQPERCTNPKLALPNTLQFRNISNEQTKLY